MNRIVCNTGPLIALGLLNRLDLLQALFKEVRFLVEAKRGGLLLEIESEFSKLRQDGYWIHDAIIEIALKEAQKINW